MGLSNYSSHPGQDVCKSQPRNFLQAIGQHTIYIESRSPDPLNKSHLGISHTWGVGHCFAWHVRVNLGFYFNFKIEELVDSGLTSGT